MTCRFGVLISPKQQIQQSFFIYLDDCYGYDTLHYSVPPQILHFFSLSMPSANHPFKIEERCSYI